MNEQAFLAAVHRVIATQLGLEENTLKPTDNILRDLHADSLDVVELEIEFEEVFDVQIGIDSFGFEEWYRHENPGTEPTEATVADVIAFLRTKVTINEQ